MAKENNVLEYDGIIKRMKDGILEDTGREVDSPDRRDGMIYDCSDELHLAVEVALATGRPLLLRGEPGTGKSSLAPYVARNLNWRYYEFVVTSTTRAEHLLWTFDSLQRLADAQVRGENNRELYERDYVEPGVLWWVFNYESAVRRGAPKNAPPKTLAKEPNKALNKGRTKGYAVVLIDEIDKADPDVPNGLLVPLGSTRFKIAETGDEVSRVQYEVNETMRNPSRLLLAITTNEERQLPPAFVRRCVVHKIKPPDDAEGFAKIGRKHFERPNKPLSKEHEKLLNDLAEHVYRIRQSLPKRERKPSTAEFLDAFRACRELSVNLDKNPDVWKILERVTLLKKDPPDEGIANE